MRRLLTVAVVAGEPELHAWCAVCQAATRVRVPLHIGSLGAPLAGVLEICPGCGTGHDRPSVNVAAAPRQCRRALVALAHAVHRRHCERQGRPAVGCAHADCPWPGLYRHQIEIPGDDGMWRLFFCRNRHRRTWAAANGIHLPQDRGDAG